MKSDGMVREKMLKKLRAECPCVVGGQLEKVGSSQLYFKSKTDWTG